jgi:6-phosphogluconolactonase (cycloisomerase 2 family)
MKSSVTSFAYDRAKGQLSGRETVSNLPADFTGTDNSAEIEDADGKFVYASNRGHDSITIFKIDPKLGSLTTSIASRRREDAAQFQDRSDRPLPPGGKPD